ncbi:MAG: saccharopine dehydrogenase NADP-binding domain-containing protein [Bacteroidota bacterium]
MTFLLYGSYGYTGRLIAEQAKEYGLTPILAGRDDARVKAQAESLGYDYRVFALDDPAELDKQMQDVSMVFHSAGPYIYTARPMMEACLRNKVHYVDITGEIEVFEMAHEFDAQAKQAGIMMLSGAGFDVVPTDCLALYLKQMMPEAVRLDLAFAGGSGLSHGTALTAVENLGKPSAERQDGKIVEVPLGAHTLTIPADPQPYFVMSIPWGDVSTAFYTTAIPNIRTYTGIAPKSYRWVGLMKYFGWLLRAQWVKNIARRRIKKGPAGPSEKSRIKSRTVVWGRVTHASGQSKEARLITPEGYTLTAITSLLITKRVLAGDLKVGFQTPAGCYGADLVMEVDGVVREELS